MIRWRCWLCGAVLTYYLLFIAFKMTNNFSFYQGIWKLIQALLPMEIDVFQASKWCLERKNATALPRDTCKSVSMLLGSLWRVLCPKGCPSAGAGTRWEDDCQAAITATKPNGDRSILLGLIQDLCCISGTKWILQWMETYGKRGSKMKNIFIAVGYMLVSFERTFFKKMNSARKEKHKYTINYDSEQSLIDFQRKAGFNFPCSY